MLRSVQSPVYAPLPVSHVPFLQVSLSRKGSSGCLLWSALEASGFDRFRVARYQRARALSMRRLEGEGGCRNRNQKDLVSADVG
jgi:hypothetical protein